MTRTITAAAETERTATFNTEAHLLNFYFAAGTIYVNTGGYDLEYGGNTYTDHGVDVSTIYLTPNAGIEQVTITAPMGDNSPIANYIAQGLHFRRECWIYQTYVDPTTQVVIDPVLIVKGRMSGGSVDQNVATCQVIPGTVPKYGYAPHRAISPENGFNHVPADGYSFVWLGEKITLKSIGQL